jgi:hypothetical protein
LILSHINGIAFGISAGDLDEAINQSDATRLDTEVEDVLGASENGVEYIDSLRESESTSTPVEEFIIHNEADLISKLIHDANFFGANNPLALIQNYSILLNKKLMAIAMLLTISAHKHSYSESGIS